VLEKNGEDQLDEHVGNEEVLLRVTDMGHVDYCRVNRFKHSIKWKHRRIPEEFNLNPIDLFLLGICTFVFTLSMFFDRASRYTPVMKPTWCTVYFQFIQTLHLYMFRASSSFSVWGRRLPTECTAVYRGLLY
jgi:hypothetical protein